MNESRSKIKRECYGVALGGLDNRGSLVSEVRLMTIGKGQHHIDRLEGLDCLSALSRVQQGTSKKGRGYDAEMAVCVRVGG